LIAEWFAKNGNVSRYTLAVDDLCILFMKHAEQYYRKNGEPTNEVNAIRSALRSVVNLYGKSPAREFGPKRLKQVRDSMVKADYCRTNINKLIGRIKRMFRWAVENEYVSPEIYTALVAVAGLKRGRTEARESKPVKPVAQGVVSDTLAYLTPTVAAMVQLQLASGARPGEVCSIRPSAVTFQTNGVWVFYPENHKTQHQGRERRIYIGPEGQALLKPYLDRDPDAYCFSPADSEAERNAERRRNRSTPMTPSQAARKPKARRGSPPKDCYTKDSYRRAVARACRKAGVEHWSPNQLRHSSATVIRERYGIEAAQMVLGHSDPKTTQIYAERDFETAARVMREIG